MAIPKDEPKVTIRLDDDEERFLVEELRRRGMSRQAFFTRLMRFYRDQPNLVKLAALGQLDPGDSQLVAEALLRELAKPKPPKRK